MPTYDPLTADVLSNITIGGTAYIVTAFNDNGAAAVGPDFQNADGSYRGCYKVSGPREASVTIEVTNNAETAPAQYATVSNYEGANWVVLTVGKAMSSGGASTRQLTLREVPA